MSAVEKGWGLVQGLALGERLMVFYIIQSFGGFGLGALVWSLSQ